MLFAELFFSPTNIPNIYLNITMGYVKDQWSDFCSISRNVTLIELVRDKPSNKNSLSTSGSPIKIILYSVYSYCFSSSYESPCMGC